MPAKPMQLVIASRITGILSPLPLTLDSKLKEITTAGYGLRTTFTQSSFLSLKI
jgi:hypothetical protein